MAVLLSLLYTHCKLMTCGVLRVIVFSITYGYFCFLLSFHHQETSFFFSLVLNNWRSQCLLIPPVTSCVRSGFYF